MPRAAHPARSVADVTAGTILATVDIDVPPQRVFAALTDPKELVQWWGSPELYQTTGWEADLRVGGKWKSVGRGADGQPFSVEGEYVEIDPPHRLVHTWRAPWDGGHLTTVHYRLEATKTGTRVTVRHEGFAGRPDSCSGHADGWQRVLGWVSGFVAPAAEPTYFFVRLLPPRPTFMADMTADERALMMEHAQYWRTQADQGVALAFGPVAGPQGGWGLGLLKAQNEAEVRAFEAQDPVMRAKRGFAYEVSPMARLVLGRW